jgi:U4/U6.U5 tri-snRNP-associated protein 3
MGRSRSRSRSRDRKQKDKRHRERSRDRERDHDRDRERKQKRREKSRSRSRTRSRSPTHHHRKSSKRVSRSPSPIGSLTLGNVKPNLKNSTSNGQKTLGKPVIVLDPAAIEGKSEEEIEMMKLMGFSGFDTTKGKRVEGASNAYAIHIQQKRRYRQYMNRKGGFNRPLDPVA